MPRRSNDLRAPVEYVSGEFESGEPSRGAPVEAAAMRRFAVELAAAIVDSGLSLSELSRRSGVDRSVLHDIVAGRVYANAVTIARLEHTLGRPLWTYQR